MKTKYIKITTLEDLSDFLKKAREVNGDVLVHRGKFCVDGKSMMGMMSVDVSQKCRIEFPEDANDFETYLTKFEVSH